MEENNIENGKVQQIEESVFLRQMKEQYVWFFGLSCLFGVIYTFCTYRNPAGITFPLCTITMISFSVLFLKKIGKTIKHNIFFYFVGILLLSISTFLTTNGRIHIFNRIGILLLFSAGMLHQMYEDKGWNFPVYVKNLFCLYGTCIPALVKPFQHMSFYMKREKKEGRKELAAILAGVGIAVLFLLVVLPLLIRSDQIFAGYFDKIFRYISVWTIFGILFQFLAGSILFYAFFAALFKQNIKEEKKKEVCRTNALTGITFTAILTVIYVFYSGIQILFLFLRFGEGLPGGVTYSQYAHSGFWQLLAVSLINIVTVLICMQMFEEHKVLKILLLIISVCTCIMAVSAAYRMVLYVKVYHLTFLRVLVLWFLGVLVLIMAGIMVSIFRRKFHLFQYIMVVVTCCYIGFSFAGVDGMIASYNISHSEELYFDDLYYLMDQLSEDAAPYIAEIDVSQIKSYDRVFTEEVGVQYEERDFLEMKMREYFQNLKEKEYSIRTWNYSGVRAKRAAEEYLK